MVRHGRAIGEPQARQTPGCVEGDSRSDATHARVPDKCKRAGAARAMTTLQAIVATVGLGLDIVGVCILFIFGIPFRASKDYVTICPLD